jgi:LPS sulfotransferase NodH
VYQGYARIEAIIPSEIKVNVRLLFRIGALPFKKRNSPEKRFVIYSLGRSGSTLLTSLLNSHHLIHCDGEIFNRFVLLPKKHLDVCVSRSEAEVYGFKLLTYHIEDVQRLLSPRQFLVYLNEVGYQFIYVTRANLLRHALSNVYARHVNFHCRSADGPPKRKAIRVEVEDVMHWMKAIEARCGFEREILQGIPFLPLSYEDDLQSTEVHQRTVDRVCDYVGVPSARVSTDLQRVTPKALSDFVINVDELSEALVGTPYARFLSDACWDESDHPGAV